MDKTLEIVVGAAVLMMIAAILFFMLSSGSGRFSTTTDNQISNSQCELWLSQGKCQKASECNWDASKCLDEGGSLNLDEGDDPVDDYQRVE